MTVAPPSVDRGILDTSVVIATDVARQDPSD